MPLKPNHVAGVGDAGLSSPVLKTGTQMAITAFLVIRDEDADKEGDGR